MTHGQVSQSWLILQGYNTVIQNSTRFCDEECHQCRYNGIIGVLSHVREGLQTSEHFRHRVFHLCHSVFTAAAYKNPRRASLLHSWYGSLQLSPLHEWNSVDQWVPERIWQHWAQLDLAQWLLDHKMCANYNERELSIYMFFTIFLGGCRFSRFKK